MFVQMLARHSGHCYVLDVLFVDPQVGAFDGDGNAPIDRPILRYNLHKTRGEMN